MPNWTSMSQTTTSSIVENAQHLVKVGAWRPTPRLKPRKREPTAIGKALAATANIFPIPGSRCARTGSLWYISIWFESKSRKEGAGRDGCQNSYRIPWNPLRRLHSGPNSPTRTWWVVTASISESFSFSSSKFLTTEQNGGLGLDQFLESESLGIDSFPWFYVNNAGIDSFLKESQCNDSFQKYEMAWFFEPDSFLNL